MRLRANTQGGYPIGSLDPLSVMGAKSGVIKLNRTDQFVMMSDGYFQYFDENKSWAEISDYMELEAKKDLLYGKRDDASVIVGRIS